MSYEREVITVQLSGQVLWIGAEAYPLHNIARARTIKFAPDRAAAVRRFLKVVVICVLVILFTAAALPSIIRSSLLTFEVFVVLGVVVFSTVQLLSVLSSPTFHALQIETSGVPRAVVVSTDGYQLAQLVGQIMDAISNPAASFQLQVEQIHIGDKINQYGDENVGKVSYERLLPRR